MTGHGRREHLLSPEIGLQTHIDDITDLVESENLEDVILVGHGYAGLVIESVADRVPAREGRLVCLDAMIPADGESVVDIDPPTRTKVESAKSLDEPWRIAPDTPTTYGWFGVTDPDDIGWLATFVGDDSALCFQQPVRIRNPLTFQVARAHIDCLRGPSPEAARRPLPDLQPNGQPAAVWPLDAGHDCMITAPDALLESLSRFTTDAS